MKDLYIGVIKLEPKTKIPINYALMNENDNLSFG